MKRTTTLEILREITMHVRKRELTVSVCRHMVSEQWITEVPQVESLEQLPEVMKYL